MSYRDDLQQTISLRVQMPIYVHSAGQLLAFLRPNGLYMLSLPSFDPSILLGMPAIA